MSRRLVRIIPEDTSCRPIKFRAWDAKKKRMLTPDDVDIVLWFDGKVGLVAKDLSVSEAVNGRFITMQFTGRLDTNGKEIWEGDIVSFYDSRTSEVIRIVAWSVGYGCWSLLSEHSAELMFEIGNDVVEVIGNIYERPELFAPSRSPINLDFGPIKIK